MGYLDSFKKLNMYYETLKKSGVIPNKLKFYLYSDFFLSLAIHSSTISDYLQYSVWEKRGTARKQFMVARKNNAFYSRINTRQSRAKLNHKAPLTMILPDI